MRCAGRGRSASPGCSSTSGIRRGITTAASRASSRRSPKRAPTRRSIWRCRALSLTSTLRLRHLMTTGDRHDSSVPVPVRDERTRQDVELESLGRGADWKAVCVPACTGWKVRSDRVERRSASRAAVGRWRILARAGRGVAFAGWGERDPRRGCPFMPQPDWCGARFCSREVRIEAIGKSLGWRQHRAGIFPGGGAGTVAHRRRARDRATAKATLGRSTGAAPRRSPGFRKSTPIRPGCPTSRRVSICGLGRSMRGGDLVVEAFRPGGSTPSGRS